MTKIVWKPIPNWDGYYEISNYGEVRTIPHVIMRSNGVRQTIQGRKLKPSKDHRGYLQVHLYRNGNRTHLTIHVGVAKTFIGDRPDGYDVCHNDGDKYNNFVGNLRYGTKSSNMYDRVKHGVHHNSIKTHCKHGHEFEVVGYYLTKTKTGLGRSCKACHKRRVAKYVQSKQSKTGRESR